MHRAINRHAVDPAAAIQTLGMSPNGSSGQRALAALIHFGLVEATGGKKNRQVLISPLGKRIAFSDEADPDFSLALKEAVLCPRLYKALWDKWEGELPADPVIRRHLLAEIDLAESVVDGFIRDFRASLDYAQLDESSGSWSQEGSEPQAARHPSTLSLFDEPDDSGTALRHRTPQYGGAPMAEIKVPGLRQFDINIPLMSGAQATLRIPIPLSEEDFDILVALLDANLKGARRALVRSEALTPTVAPDAVVQATEASS